MVPSERDLPSYGQYAERKKSPGTWVLSEIQRHNNLRVQTAKNILTETRIAVPRKVKGWGGVPPGMKAGYFRMFYQLTPKQVEELLLASVAREEMDYLRKRRMLLPPGAGETTRFDKARAWSSSILAKYLRKRRCVRPSGGRRTRYSVSTSDASTG